MTSMTPEQLADIIDKININAKTDREAQRIHNEEQLDLLKTQLQRSEERNNQLADTIANLQAGHTTPNTAQIRATKIEKILEQYRKTINVNKFSTSQKKSIRYWLDGAEAEMELICNNYGLKVTDLKDPEKILLVKSKLPHPIIKNISNDCLLNKQKSLEEITYGEFTELLLKHCSAPVPLVNVVMNLFGPDRKIKAKDTPMLDHAYSFKPNLHSCMTPDLNSTDELISFVDLIQRSAFCASLDDPEVQNALIEVPDQKQNYNHFTEVAIAKSEQLSGKKSLQETFKKVEPQTDTATSVLKFDGNHHTSTKRGRGSYRSRGRGRGGKNHKSVQQDPSDQNDPKSGNNNDATEIVCHGCGVKGHKRPKCPNKYKPAGNSSISDTAAGQVATRSFNISEPSDATFSPSVYSVFNPHNKKGDHIEMSVILNGDLPVLMEFDTGAGACVLPQSYIDAFTPGKRPTVQQCNVKLDLANGQTATVVGLVHIDVVTSVCPKMKPVRTLFYIVDGPHALMGRPLIKGLFPELYSCMTRLAGELYKYHEDKENSRIPILASDVVNNGNVNSSRSQNTDSEEASKNHNAVADDSIKDNGAQDVPAPLIASSLQTGKEDISPCSKLPPPPSDVSQKEGQGHCKHIAAAHPKLFDGKQGSFDGVLAKIKLKPDAESKMKVMPPPKVPAAIQKQYNEQLDKLEKTGTYVSGVGLKVASQLIPVVTLKNGEPHVRLCGNYKTTINPLIEDELFNFPSADDQCDKLKGEHFSVIDVEGAYMQCKNHKNTKKYLTLSTPRGFLEPDRLQYGVKTAPAIFGSNMSQLLQGIPSTACVVDDICITGKTPEEHFKNLESVLHRLQEAGLKVNPKKCKFYLPEVKYLGRIISKDGIRMDPSAIDAILKMPSPSSRHELQSFLGYLSYVRRFVPDLARVTPELSSLLKKDVKFIWTEKHEAAFQRCKELAGNMATLAHFDESKELVLTTDASPVGIGACLSHRIIGEDGKSYLHPIAYASRTLNAAEKNYAQVEREGLAVIWAVKYFRQYLYCRHFILQTDCSALTRIFGNKNDLGGCALGRTNRWCVELMEYIFTAQHIKGDKNLVCDSLSRLPKPSPDNLLIADSGNGLPGHNTAEFVNHTGSISPAMCLSVLPVLDSEIVQCYKSEVVAPFTLHGFPLTANDIAKATREDPLYGRVLNAVRTGVFDHKDKTLSPFISIKDNLTVEAGCLLYGSRVIVPSRQQPRLLFELHHTHMGIVKMKSLAREYVWWPGLNKDIEDLAAKCKGCAKFRKKPAPVPLTHWPWATRPMERLHIDFAEYKGVQLLIVVDAFTKFLWTFVMNKDTTTTKLVRRLDSVFIERGLPTIIVSDNGPQFTSKEFADNMKSRNIKHVLTPPYHPASNGLAEVAVGIIKSHLHKMDASAYLPSLEEAILKILFQYRATPNTSTGRTPFELMESNKVQTPLSLVRPSLQRRNETHQQQKVCNKDRVTSATLRTFDVGENVLVYDTISKTNDIGKVIKKVGCNSYHVMLNGRVKLVSADVISKCVIQSDDSNPENVPSDNFLISGNDKDCDLDSVTDKSEGDYNIYSSSDDDDDFSPRHVGIAVQSRSRHRKNEAQRLQDSLCTGPVMSRTRSGHN